MQIVHLTRDQWRQYTENAHLICFGEHGYGDLDRCDYALLVVDNDLPLMYATIKEIDALSGYLQRGGAFPSVKGTAASYRAFELILQFLKQRYPYLSMRVQNTNTPMLKFAMKAGFVIDGISYFKEKIFLEHTLGVENVVANSNTGDNSNDGREQSTTPS